MSERTAQQATIKRATISAQKAAEQLDEEALDELAKLYKQAADEITDKIGGYSGADGNISLQEMQSVLAQIYIHLKKLSDQRDALMNRNLSTAAHIGIQPFGLSASAAMQINHEALKIVRNFVAEDGLQLSDRIWRLDRHAKDKVTNAIEMAVIQGHGATQSAREFLARGEPVPIELQDKISSASSKKISKDATDALLTGQGSPMDNAMRVMRTEINRAHGEAYIKGALSHPDSAGIRFTLSPAHPKHDICDFHATANLYGLGSGVYPNRESCPWPAHPNTLSFVEVVFHDEVTEKDQAGKETPMQTLDRMTPAQRIGVLGVNKHEAYKDGKLTQGMINTPWNVVQKRINTNVPTPQPKPSIKPAPISVKKPSDYQLDDFIAIGRDISTELLNKTRAQDGSLDGSVLLAKLHEQLRAERPMMTPAKVESGGKGADLIQKASLMYPDDWTKAADRHGPLYAKFSTSRGYYVGLQKSSAGKRYKLLGQVLVARGGDGFITAGKFSTAVHEYAHRLQESIPELDDLFQELHHRRTNGEPLERLKDLKPNFNYDRNEVSRKDKYREPYQGKIYTSSNYLGKHGALEVMTMAFQDVLSGKSADMVELVENDREMFDLVIGLLFKYVP